LNDLENWKIDVAIQFNWKQFGEVIMVGWSIYSVGLLGYMIIWVKSPGTMCNIDVKYRVFQSIKSIWSDQVLWVMGLVDQPLRSGEGVRGVISRAVEMWSVFERISSWMPFFWSLGMQSQVVQSPLMTFLLKDYKVSPPPFLNLQKAKNW
jgi:hypothetical protein